MSTPTSIDDFSVGDLFNFGDLWLSPPKIYIVGIVKRITKVNQYSYKIEYLALYRDVNWPTASRYIWLSNNYADFDIIKGPK